MDSTIAVAVVVGLGSGLLSGLGGTLLSTRHDRDEGERQREHERRESACERQINAADAFLQAVAQVLNTAEDFESMVRKLRQREDGEALVDRAAAHLQEALMHAQRLPIVFPPSAVYEAALEVLSTGAAMCASLATSTAAELGKARFEFVVATRAFQDAVVAVTQ